MPVQLPDVPTSVTAALDLLTEELRSAAGSNLAGLILYGGLARGRYRPGRSDVNVLVLLHDASNTALASITPALRRAWRAAGVNPLLLTPADFAGAADAFPTKFLDIQRHHIVLAGADPFPSLHITPEQIRLRTAQDLHNLLLRLRHRYVAAAGDPGMLAHALARAARPLALDLAALLELAGKPAPAEDRTASIFDAAAAAFALPSEPLARLAELRQEVEPATDLNSLYADLLAVLARAAAVADRMEENRQ